MFPKLPNNQYQILYADPPWDYKGQTQHAGKQSSNTGGASSHYPTITLNHLKTLNIPQITASNALLFLWTSSPHLPQAIQLGEAWKFKYATIAFIWDKQKTNPGFYTLSQCEICLVFKKGKIPQPRGKRNIRQFISKQRTAHSEKPIEVRQRIYEMFPDLTKIELFARTSDPQWHSWGNEAPHTA
jgi:N6-adenosine-specific RNA methylase IME4